SLLRYPCFSSSAAICGTSCAENAPPASAVTPISVQIPPVSHSASAMLPCLPEVSVARRSIENVVSGETVSRCSRVFGSVSQQASVHGHFPFASHPAVYLARAPFPVEVFAAGVAPQGIDIDHRKRAIALLRDLNLLDPAMVVDQ